MEPERSSGEKTALHPRNKNRERYDFDALVAAVPGLKKFIKPDKSDNQSIDFANPVAVKLLNKALLSHYYGIDYWEFPDANLCPPIPGRADYIHHLADLLTESFDGVVPVGGNITCLDIGVGAGCIYPILGVSEYGWKFIGTDIDPKSIASSQNIADKNPTLKDHLEFQLQNNKNSIFKSILDPDEKIDLTLCNPPFHSSAAEAMKGTQRKVRNLSGKTVKAPQLNFAGVGNELVFEGGEVAFITTMVTESKSFAKNCYWFSTLVSKQSNLKSIYNTLKLTGAVKVKTINMGTGNKITRIVAWTFLTHIEQKHWRETRWK